MRFTEPNALFLLLLIPIFIYIGWPRSRFRRRREVGSLVLRLLLVLVIVLSLAGLEIPREADRLAVVFLVDVSDSMGRDARDAAVEYVRQSVAEMNPERDEAAVILFGENAVVEQPMADAIELGQLGGTPITLNTDISEAIRLGLALFPSDAARRLVILSDGVETVGDAESAARLAAATEVQIDYVPFQQPILPQETLVQGISIPPRVNEEEAFTMVVNVQSQTDTPAIVRVLAGGGIVYQQEHVLTEGQNRIAIRLPGIPSSGFVDFRVQVDPLNEDEGDIFQNNELAAFTEVRGNPTILLVAQDEQEVQYLRPALESNGYIVEVVEPSRLPSSLAALSAYRSIVLVNAPATEMSPAQMELLQIYVRDLGGGLVAVGGPNAYGVGGYFETPLEETLPVEMRIRDEQRIPSLTMMFVIDRSGSMEMVSGAHGLTNLELAKEAILRSFNLLNDYDRTGVMSFDTSAYFVLDLQDVGDASNRAQMENTVASLRPGGGTDIYGALATSSQILPSDPSTLKHMILLTDGGANPEGTLEIAENMYNDYGITLSVVAVGQGYAPWLRDLAAAGHGNFHETSDPATIPSIFAAETVLATRSYIFEEEFVPTVTARSPITDGITSAPSLLGYVATTEKDTATVIYRTPEDDPLLASWQYGLGRAVAFTSDASARWGTNWVSWEQYANFWSQAVNWTITEGSDENLEARVEQRGDQTYLVVDARTDDGEFLNSLDMSASIVAPDLDPQTVEIPQVAPGRYELPIAPDSEGAYFMRVVGTGENARGSAISVGQTTGWVLSYSPEYRLLETDRRFLSNIAGLTGGGSLQDNPAAAFDRNLTLQKTYSPVWPYLLALAALLLVLDVAARRLIITRTDVQRMRAAIAARLPQTPAARRAATSGRMTGLMDVKRRTVEETQAVKPAPAATIRNLRDQRQSGREDVPSAPSAPPPSTGTPSQPTPSASRPPAPTPTPKTEAPRQTPPKSAPGGGTLASRLLESRKRDEE